MIQQNDIPRNRLKLKRKVGQTILLDESIVEIEHLTPSSVFLVVHAPDYVRVLRGELTEHDAEYVPHSPAMPGKLAAHYGRRIGVHLMHGNWEAARDLVDQAAEEALHWQLREGRHQPVAPDELAIAELLNDVRMANALEKGLGVRYVGELMTRRLADLDTIPNWSERSTQKLQTALAKINRQMS